MTASSYGYLLRESLWKRGRPPNLEVEMLEKRENKCGCCWNTWDLWDSTYKNVQAPLPRSDSPIQTPVPRGDFPKIRVPENNPGMDIREKSRRIKSKYWLSLKKNDSTSSVIDRIALSTESFLSQSCSNANATKDRASLVGELISTKLNGLSVRQQVVMEKN